MNVLIIGSKGFIGSHLYHHFKRQTNVICFGCDLVKDFTDNKYFTITNNKADLDSLFSVYNFDVCINCSGAANVHDSLIHTLHDFELNVYNVILFLDLIKKYQPKCKFINLSSAAVYGNPICLPISESDKISPVSPYGIHKSISEHLCLEYHSYFAIPTLSLRIFSVFGPGLKKQILWDWYCKSLSYKEVPLMGNGRESRDYIYIDDLISVIDLAIINSEFKGSCVNVANGNEIFIADIARIFFDCLNKPYIFTGYTNVSDPLNWKANIDEIINWGYKQNVTINDGVIKFIQWAKGLN